MGNAKQNGDRRRQYANREPSKYASQLRRGVYIKALGNNVPNPLSRGN